MIEVPVRETASLISANLHQGANLYRSSAANSSPPPCGEGLGVGVVGGGTALPQPPNPQPNPPPAETAYKRLAATQ